ncbi:MAG: lantibiotic dehydratase, partial [Bacteroidota bacterium]
MINRIPFNLMNVFVSRSPILPLNFFLDVTRESKLSDDAVKTLFLTNEIIREFIYVSSPSLYRVLDKWVDGATIKNKEKERLKISFLKYISRASSRCTPFGLFAGCSVGEIGDKTDIRLGGIDEFKRKTVLDTRILALIAKKLLEQDKVKTHLIFYPNTSIYYLGQELRYVRSLFVNDQKQHTIVSIKENPFLKEILAKAKDGCKRKSLIELLTNQDIPYNAASKFIDEIIETQLLVSELEVCVTDDQDELLRIISILRRTKHLKELENSLTVINNKLTDLDKQIGNPNKKYLDIKVALEKLLGQKLPEENMFQVDLFPTATKSELAGEIGESVLNGLSILNQLSATESKVELDNFKKSFYRRYERRGVPLAEVLDTDVGIGYGRDDNAGEMNPLIDN